MVVNDESEGMRKEEVLAQYNILSWQLPVGA